MRSHWFLVVGAVASLSLAQGCSDSAAPTVGTLQVEVLDASDKGVPLVDVDLYQVTDAGDVLLRSSRTDSNGVTVFGDTDGALDAGTYSVHVSFVTNYHLATGETNDKAVTVEAGAQATVTFHVAPSSPGL